MEERMLVKKAKRGEAEAFGALYERVYKKLYAYAYYTLKRSEDAEDVVSEAVMDAWTSIGTLKKEEAFSGWIFRIVANKCNQKMREYYRQSEELTDELHCAADVQPEWSDEREEYIEVRDVFLALPEEERRIISMHVFFGYTTKEIAAYLNMNENTVRSKEHRALKKMSGQIIGLG